jgi:transcriptional regulator with XRE-family HTH domain
MRNSMEMPSSMKEVKSTTESAVKIEDVTLFGKLLSKQRGTKQSNEIAEKLGVIPSSVSAWENGRAFPEVGRESAVADAYGIKLEELIEVLEISKKARKLEKDALNHPRKFVPRGRSDTEVYGPGGDNGHRNSPKNPQP